MLKTQEVFDKAIEREKAILFLKEKGVLIDFDSKLHLFHGRVNTSDKRFFVDPNFDNSGQTLGHHNNNNIPGLHASGFDIAMKYAEKRFVEDEDNKDKKIEVHQIVPTADDLTILNLQKLFDIEEIEQDLSSSCHLSSEEIEAIKKDVLSEQDKQKVCDAIKTISSSESITSIMPKLFSTKESVVILRDLKNICKNNKDNKPYVLDSDLEKYVQRKAKGDAELEEQIYDITGALNVYQILTEQGDIKMLMSKFQSDLSFTEDATLNLNFFREFLRNENIVGVKQKLWLSDVIGQTNFDDYFLFDTSRINSETAVKKIERSNQKERGI